MKAKKMPSTLGGHRRTEENAPAPPLGGQRPAGQGDHHGVVAGKQDIDPGDFDDGQGVGGGDVNGIPEPPPVSLLARGPRWVLAMREAARQAARCRARARHLGLCKRWSPHIVVQRMQKRERPIRLSLPVWRSGCVQAAAL